MELFGLNISWGKKNETQQVVHEAQSQPTEAQHEEPTDMQANRRSMQANVFGPGNNRIFAGSTVFAVFDGEKTLASMGPAKVYAKDFLLLRIRSKQMYLESDICRAAVDAFEKWTIGRGYNLKIAPQIATLARRKIKVDNKTFNGPLEELWKIYCSSTECDYAGASNMNQLRTSTYHEGKLCGDILVILRVVGTTVKIQVVDTTSVANPPYCTTRVNNNHLTAYPDYAGYDYIIPETGNRVRMGVEIDNKGEVVAYHVRTGTTLTYERVKRKDSKGFVRAFMYYGNKENAGDTRGTPLLAVVMERAKQLDRYLAASVMSAEERANIAYYFKHGTNSTNEDPLAGRKAVALVARPAYDAPLGATTDIGKDVSGNIIAEKMAASTQKTVINAPNDVSIESLESKQELHVGEFTTIITDLICAALGVPPDVVFKKYLGSFSSARMGGKDWEHSFLKDREDFIQQFDSNVLALQMYVWALAGEINAPGFVEAVENGDWVPRQAYLYAKWTGAKFPDIDPLKTIQTAREVAGVAFEAVPFATMEDISETLDGSNGNIFDIIIQAGEELAAAKAAGIQLPEQSMPSPSKAEKPTEGDAKRNLNK